MPPPPSPSRRQVYATLLAHPQRSWTIRSLTEAVALPSTAGITAGTVRDIVNVLLASRLADLVPGHRALTFVLNSRGEQDLAAAVHTEPHNRSVPDDRQRPR